MKNITKLSAIVLSTLFATMQISIAGIDTGLGLGNGGAVINNATGGFNGVQTGVNSATLNFTGNSHVNWDTLNVNKGETLNFNAINGANGLTVLNTVNQGMSKIYGDINANSGIGKLIISNPNGVLFDGAKFTTTGDTMITTKNMMDVDVNNLTNGKWDNLGTLSANTRGNKTINLTEVRIKDSNFNVGGEFNIVAPKIAAEASTIKVGNGLKLVTANGADYFSAYNAYLAPEKEVTSLKAMNIDGNIEIVNDNGALLITDGQKADDSIAGTTINGNLKAEVGGIGYIGTKDDATTKVEITGNADLTGHGEQLIARNTNVGGNLTMKNDGGAVELRNANVGGNANLTTTGWQPVNHEKYDHYVHVSGNTNVDGNLDINSSQNVHIGNYRVTQEADKNHLWGGEFLDGKLTVGGDLNAKTTGGHIMTTIDTTAKNINYEAQSRTENGRVYGGNILSDDKATLTADTYKFKSDGYIGGLKTTKKGTVDDKIVNTMEEYVFTPADTSSHEYMNINGGTISKIETPKVSSDGKPVQVYIKSKNDLLVNGANAGDINLVAPDKQITITGNDVHANNINIGGRTKILKLDFPQRDFTTNYTNIKDGVVKTIRPNEEITYELTNKPNEGYNHPNFDPTKLEDGTNVTYLVGPGAPITPPEPEPQPEPNNPSNPSAPGDDNVRLWNQVPDDPMRPGVSTPVAFAADLDDDQYGPCRKNVDGSVTVVRAYPMMN